MGAGRAQSLPARGPWLPAALLAGPHIQLLRTPPTCMMRSIFWPSPGGRNESMNMRSARSKSMPAPHQSFGDRASTECAHAGGLPGAARPCAFSFTPILASWPAGQPAIIHAARQPSSPPSLVPTQPTCEVKGLHEALPDFLVKGLPLPQDLPDAALGQPRAAAQEARHRVRLQRRRQQLERLQAGQEIMNDW
jgi:hypothetical protein